MPSPAFSEASVIQGNSWLLSLIFGAFGQAVDMANLKFYVSLRLLGALSLEIP